MLETIESSSELFFNDQLTQCLIIGEKTRESSQDKIKRELKILSRKDEIVNEKYKLIIIFPMSRVA